MARFFLLILLIAPFKIFAIIIGGTLTTNTVLTAADNPHHVTEDLQVPVGITLEIGPGVDLQFSPTISLKVDGQLRVLGTSTNPVKFGASHISLPWGGVFFYNNAVDFDSNTNSGCLIEYAEFSDTGGDTGTDLTGSSNDWTIKAIQSTICVRHCKFTECSSGMGFLYKQGGYFQHNEVSGTLFMMDHDYYDTEYFYFQNNYIHDIPTVGSFATSPLLTTGLGVIENNIFENCTSYFVKVLLRVSKTCEIRNNEFINSPQAWAIAILGGDNHIVENNYFENNLVHIVQGGARQPTVINNCFGSYVDYYLYLTANQYGYVLPFFLYDTPAITGITEIDYSNNYVQGASELTIGDMYFDYYDDVSDLLICNALPLKTSCTLNELETEIAQNNFTLFPNPTNGVFSIQFPDQLNIENSSIQIYNTLGEIVWHNQNLTDSNLSDIHLSDLEKGIYYVTISDAYGALFTQKLILQ